jgi:2-polyprenyl-3-methyl-5-hydroxy-6-metoxy-1,4-benzoquinol methylase
MKTLDRLLQQWRISKVKGYLTSGSRVLDIGCADGTLLRMVPGLREYVGIDPDLACSSCDGCTTFIKGYFPDGLADASPFDAITMLAVLEHIPAQRQTELARDCAAFLRPGGYLLITVPSPVVDYVLTCLRFLHLIDGMSLEQHYGYDVKQTPHLFNGGAFRLARHARFQLGLNHLFVFQRM